MNGVFFLFVSDRLKYLDFEGIGFRQSSSLGERCTLFQEDRVIDQEGGKPLRHDLIASAKGWQHRAFAYESS